MPIAPVHSRGQSITPDSQQKLSYRLNSNSNRYRQRGARYGKSYVMPSASWDFQFFFSSRRRHTRYIGDWSSDVCSSDLNTVKPFLQTHCLKCHGEAKTLSGLRLDTLGIDFLSGKTGDVWREVYDRIGNRAMPRSEERRVGKEGRSRWMPCRKKIKTKDAL